MDCQKLLLQFSFYQNLGIPIFYHLSLLSDNSECSYYQTIHSIQNSFTMVKRWSSEVLENLGESGSGGKNPQEKPTGKFWICKNRQEKSDRKISVQPKPTGKFSFSQNPQEKTHMKNFNSPIPTGKFQKKSANASRQYVNLLRHFIS